MLSPMMNAVTRGESGETRAKACDSRTWELRPAVSLYQLPAYFVWWFIFFGGTKDLGSLFITRDESQSNDYLQLAAHCLSLLCLVWMHWYLMVNFLYFFAARRITVTWIGNEPRFEIRTALLLQPVIEPAQISRIELGWPGQVAIRYRAKSRVWQWTRWLAIMPALAVTRRQFPDDLSWRSFLHSLPGEQKQHQEYQTEIAAPSTSGYPPTYPEMPCPACGLRIPSYEATCPNCATPRPESR